MAKKTILALNNISKKASALLGDKYKLTNEASNPDAIILRSFDMHKYDLPKSVLGIARAGAGTNNIPIDKYTENGVVVFNTPGANANAVKELVIASMLMCGRKIVSGIEWTKTLKGKGNEVASLVESGKKQFDGKELYGKTLGVIGLGAIGALVANIGYSLGMNVLGYDPALSVESAWRLDRHVKKETSVASLISKSDFVSIHVPFLDSTKNMINADMLSKAKSGISIINLARGGIVNDKDILNAVKSGKVYHYVTDFPSDELIGVENIICLPHLGASTPEAEDNCAIMAVNQITDFLENGNVVNSVNFPACSAPREGAGRVTLVHKNEKGILGKITDTISSAGENIENLLSKAKGDYAYAIVDFTNAVSEEIINKLNALDGVVRIRIV